MTDIGNQTAASKIIDAVLEGGPTDLPAALRTTRIPVDCQKIKVEHRGGYEHFERDAEAVGNLNHRQLTFRWTDRTTVAE